jgi:large subunit ribosomal protein L15
MRQPPQRGFKSTTLRQRRIRLDLERLAVTEIDVLTLKQAGLVPELVRAVKVIAAGTLTKKVTLRHRRDGGCKAAIEAAGGTVA